MDANQSKRWVFLYRSNGRTREAGLGSIHGVSLARAREKAGALRAAVADGRDPIAEKQVERPAALFGEFADNLIETLKSEWRNETHVAQWSSSLTAHAASLRLKHVAEITTADVLAVLEPIWGTLPETASRVRGRIERILDAATARGLRQGENPARWRGHLVNLLPRRNTLSRGHHRALPIKEAPKFFGRLCNADGVAALALQFAILTAARTGEVRLATWTEIDLEAKVWTLAAERMKARRSHRVPLTDAAIKALTKARMLNASSPFLFSAPGKLAPLSSGSLERVLDRLDVDATVHGFRSTFRDWAADATGHPPEVARAALAHTVGDKVEAAYRRGDALDKRRLLMTDWAEFLAGTAGGGST